MRFIDLSDRRKDGLLGFAGDSVKRVSLLIGRRGNSQPAYSTDSPRLMRGAAADSAAPCIRLLRRDTPGPSRNHCDTSIVRDFTANLGLVVWGAIYKSS